MAPTSLHVVYVFHVQSSAQLKETHFSDERILGHPNLSALAKRALCSQKKARGARILRL